MTLKIREETKEDNIVRLSYTKDNSAYIKSVVTKAQPKIYKKFGCIKIRAGRNVLGEAEHLCQLFKHLGILKVKEEPCKIEMKDGYLDGFEITLKKMGAIDLPEDI